MLEDLQPEARLALESVLYDDEELLWVAPPVCREGRWRAVGKSFLCLAYLLATGCIALLSMEGLNDKRILLLLFLAVLCALALVVWLSCRLVLRRVRKMLYAVTSSRAVIIAPPYFGKPQASCYPIKKDLVKKVIILSESGDIIFEERSNSDGLIVSRTGFIGCPQVREVYRYLSDKAEELAPADAQG